MLCFSFRDKTKIFSFSLFLITLMFCHYYHENIVLMHVEGFKDIMLLVHYNRQGCKYDTASILLLIFAFLYYVI